MEEKKPMPRSDRSKEEATRRDVEVLATLLVAYPEVSRATFDPTNKTLAIVFLCRGPLKKAVRNQLIQTYKDSVEVYQMLVDRQAEFVKAHWETMERFYCFQVERDVLSLTPGELNLTVDLVRDNTKIVLSGDGSDEFSEGEEYTVSARLFLQEMLDRVRAIESPRKLVALREGERVLVFDK